MTKSQQKGWFILEDFSQGSLRSTLTVLILTKSLWSNLGFLHARQSTNTSIWLSTNQLWLSVYPITHTSKGMSNIFQVHKGFENLLRKHYIAPRLTSFLYWGICTRSLQRFSKIKLSLDKPSQVGWKTCLLHIKLTPPHWSVLQLPVLYSVEEDMLQVCLPSLFVYIEFQYI